MATEATVEGTVDTPDIKLTTISANDFQDDKPDRATLNGSPAGDDVHNKLIAAVEQLDSTEPSVSGGSDTEASKPDILKSQDDRGHARTSSAVKKPATFKAVSVNKTFLASKGAAGSLAAKLGDKTSSTPSLSASVTGTSNLSATRPRLVAKSGSGARDSGAKFSSVVNGRSGLGPDPSAVWNKNRPVAPPDPKTFTDEQLQRYGIHMASRLAPSAANGQSNWADIDDDDEGWAPESITWTDGTKITLPQADETPLPTPGPEPVPAPVIEKPVEKPTEKPKSPVPPISSSSPAIKPGVLASGKGLILKGGGSADKPTLVARPPAPPTPVKSPWAALPPVDKASPLVMDLPQGQGQSGPMRMMTKESGDARVVASQPTKQIAPDDFSRSWREGSSNANRELFNSHSGRYEPAPDRRGSFRHEQHNRQPALLQRGPIHEGPPEPSAAFQTNRTTQEGPFGRRRGSSNVSGGSGSYLQRLKGLEAVAPPPEALNIRRGSMAGSAESPVSPRNFSPSGLATGPRLHPSQALQQRTSPNMHHVKPFYTAPNRDGPGEGQSVADVEQFQKSVMAEKIRLARERKQAEEARAEEEKQERIRKKLEQLGPAPERKSEREAAAAKEESAAAQNHTGGGGQLPAESAVPAVSVPPTILQPSQPASTGPRGAAMGDGKPVDGAVMNRPVSMEGPPKDSGVKPNTPWDGRKASQAERLSGWGATNQQSARNVWGSPNNDRGLGNGTFNSELTSGSEPVAAILPHAKTGPAPIAPPSANRHGQAPTTQQPSGDWIKQWGSFAETAKLEKQQQLADRAERDRKLAERGLTAEKAQTAINETWRPVTLPGDATRIVVAGSGEMRRHDAQSRAAGPTGQAVDDKARAQQPRGTQDIRLQDYTPTSVGLEAGAAGQAAMLPPSGPSAATQSRPSRFFPSRDIRLESQQSIGPERPSSPTPPPPTMAGHPAYDGDVSHPHVSLPRPQPVVKLPPTAAPASAPKAPGLQSRVNASYPRDTGSGMGSKLPPAGSPGAHRMDGPNSDNGSWQDRINNLLGPGRKATSPPKAIGVEPASRSALDQTQYSAATVSLPIPTTANYSPVDDQTSWTTKPMAEECFEEQEMGSLPQVTLPQNAPYAAWTPAMPLSKPPHRRFTGVTAISREVLHFGPDMSGSGNVFLIKFPWMKEARMVTQPFGRTRSNPRRGGSHPRGPRQASAAHRGGNRSREGSAQLQSDAGGPSRPTGPTGPSNSGPALGRGGRGFHRGRGGENWSRHAQASLPA